MYNYAIKITGAGSSKDLAEALRELANTIELGEVETSATWEDPILSTDIYVSDNSKEIEASIEAASRILCENDELEGNTILAQIKLIEEFAKEKPDEYIDWVEGVIVWDKVANTYTCEEFLEEIGW